jgi:hypothetical protein
MSDTKTLKIDLMEMERRERKKLELKIDEEKKQ